MEYHGYTKRVLTVDLTERRFYHGEVDDSLLRRFIGGFGINSVLFHRLFRPKTDALSPDNPIVIGAGPFVGSSIPGAVRVMVTTKFPLTNSVASASGSRSFGFKLKKAGYDNITLTGASSDPVYLKITNDDVEIIDARELWGRSTSETAEFLYKRHKKASVVCIGPAGENLVRFSMAILDRASSLGRGGLGAVFGSKKLKAIVVQGSNHIAAANPDQFKEIRDGLLKRQRKYPERDESIKLGLMANWDNYTKQLFSYKNWTKIKPIKEVTDLFGPWAYEKVKSKRISCPTCFLPDKDILKIEDHHQNQLTVYTPSYFNMALIGSRIGLKNYREAVYVAHLLDDYGICMFTFSSMIDFLMTLLEQGAIGKGNIPFPERMDFDFCKTIVEEIAFRKEMGDLIADGWHKTINEIDPKIQKFASIIKGSDTLWDPRIAGMGTMEFEQVVCPRGPSSASAGSPTYIPGLPIELFQRHTQRMGAPDDAIERLYPSEASEVNIGRLTRYSEDWYSNLSSLGICNRHMINRFYSNALCADLYSAVTGENIEPIELETCAERSWNLLKMINQAEGFSRRDDEFPEMWFKPIMDADGNPKNMQDYYGTKKLSHEDCEGILNDYYDERGWEASTGLPSKKKLEELGLGNFLAK
jgi:aldehyde:ferredoxin oxidoreductase